MAEYQLTANEHMILRTEDSAYIPDDPANRDYQEYEVWLHAGGVPDPYVPPPDPNSMPGGNVQDAMLLNHENRIRGFEGREPISLQNFTRETARR